MLQFNPWSDFAEISLDLRRTYQSQTTVEFVTVVEPSQTFAETRRPTSPYPVRSYTVDGQTLAYDDVSTILEFFTAMRGRLTGFRFRDLSNYRLTAKPIFSSFFADTGAGIWTQGLLLRDTYLGPTQRRVYQVTSFEDKDGTSRQVLKPIYKLASYPVPVDLTTGLSLNPVAVDSNSGVLTFDSSYPFLAVSVDFDTPVRFDQDNLSLTFTSTSLRSIIVPANLPAVAIPDYPVIAAAGYMGCPETSKASLETLKLKEIIPNVTPQY